VVQHRTGSETLLLHQLEVASNTRHEHLQRGSAKVVDGGGGGQRLKSCTEGSGHGRIPCQVGRYLRRRQAARGGGALLCRCPHQDVEANGLPLHLRLRKQQSHLTSRGDGGRTGCGWFSGSGSVTGAMPSGVLLGAAGAALEADALATSGAWQAGACPLILDCCSGAGLAAGAALACGPGVCTGSWTAWVGLTAAGWAPAGPGLVQGLSRTTRCRECGEPSACANSSMSGLSCSAQTRKIQGAGVRTRFKIFLSASASFLSTRPAWMTCSRAARVPVHSRECDDGGKRSTGCSNAE
jgi:hypothetical protein